MPVYMVLRVKKELPSLDWDSAFQSASKRGAKASRESGCHSELHSGQSCSSESRSFADWNGYQTAGGSKREAGKSEKTDKPTHHKKSSPCTYAFRLFFFFNRLSFDLGQSIIPAGCVSGYR
jgi:hypothetical protein